MAAGFDEFGLSPRRLKVSGQLLPDKNRKLALRKLAGKSPFDNQEGNTKFADETKIAIKLVAGDTIGGKPGVFGRQASGEDAHSFPCADEDATPHVYFYALFDTDAAADSQPHVHADPADGYAHSDAYQYT